MDSDIAIDFMPNFFLGNPILFLPDSEKSSLYMAVFGTGTPVQTVASPGCRNHDMSSGSQNWKATQPVIRKIKENSENWAGNLWSFGNAR